MKTYAATSSNFVGEVYYTFDSDGLLICMEFKGIAEKEVHRTLCQKVPVDEQMMLYWKQNSPKMRISLLPPDLTFETFWLRYNYKHGKKEAERAWERTSNANKLIAITNITPYDKYIARKNIAKAYPATYLNKERYLDELK